MGFVSQLNLQEYISHLVNKADTKLDATKARSAAKENAMEGWTDKKRGSPTK
jgi:flagellar biosynthesis chaperone FliJ